MPTQKECVYVAYLFGQWLFHGRQNICICCENGIGQVASQDKTNLPVHGGRRVIGSRCVVNWSRGLVRGRGVRVNGGALVGDLGNIATIVVGCVPHCLDTTIREGHRVGALRNDLGLLKRSDSV